MFRELTDANSPCEGYGECPSEIRGLTCFECGARTERIECVKALLAKCSLTLHYDEEDHLYIRVYGRITPEEYQSLKKLVGLV